MKSGKSMIHEERETDEERKNNGDMSGYYATWWNKLLCYLLKNNI